MTLSLRGKIAIVATPPLVAFVIVAGLRLRELGRQSMTLMGMQHAVHLLEVTSRALDEVRAERAVALGSGESLRASAPWKTQRQKTDAAIADVDRYLEDPATGKAWRQIGRQAVNALTALHADLEAGAPNANRVLAGYQAVIEAFLDAEGSVRELPAFADFKPRLLAVSSLDVAGESASWLSANLLGILASRLPLNPAQIEQLLDLRASTQGTLATPALSVSDESRPRLAEFLERSPHWRHVRRVLQDVITHSATGDYGELPSSAAADFETAGQELLAIRSAEIAGLSHDLQKASRSTWIGEILFVGFLATVLLGLAVGLWFSVQAMTVPIIRSITQLGQSSRSLGNASLELQQTSDHVSAGATRAAASLQQTTRSLGRINESIQSNARNAGQAAEISGQSESVARRGKQAVTEATQAIDRVHQSIRTLIDHITQSNRRMEQIAGVIGQIGDKTRVINDIVFQTKLLAFNAAVEAARAGEHGKGFAVVADEVGSLAQMSGNAAKEIGTMLDASIGQVNSVVQQTQATMAVLMKQGSDSIDNGVQVTGQCALILDEIVRKATELRANVDEISRASLEQAEGTREITLAIEELQQVTRGNAESSSQVAHSTVQLTSQSRVLNDIIKLLERTVLGAGVAARPAPAAPPAAKRGRKVNRAA
jgi:methyl-accepting chemotaxis protein